MKYSKKDIEYIEEFPLKVTMAGNTNTGKTTWLRTLARSIKIGTARDEPDVTTEITEDAYCESLPNGASPFIQFSDVQGCHDFSELLNMIEENVEEDPTAEVLRKFCKEGSWPDYPKVDKDKELIEHFLDCDIALFVVDCREAPCQGDKDTFKLIQRTGTKIIAIMNCLGEDSSASHLKDWEKVIDSLSCHGISHLDAFHVDLEERENLAELMAGAMKTCLQNEHAKLRTKFMKVFWSQYEQRLEETLQSASRILAKLLVVTATKVCVRKKVDHASEVGKKVVEELQKELGEYLFTENQDAGCQIKETFGFPELGSSGYGNTEDEKHLKLVKKRGNYSKSGSIGAGVGGAAGLAIDLTLGGLTGFSTTAAGAALGASIAGAFQKAFNVIYRDGCVEVRLGRDALVGLLGLNLELVCHLARRGHGTDPAIELPAPKELNSFRESEVTDFVIKVTKGRGKWNDFSKDFKKRDEAIDKMEKMIAGKLIKLLEEDPFKKNSPLQVIADKATTIKGRVKEKVGQGRGSVKTAIKVMRILKKMSPGNKDKKY